MNRKNKKLRDRDIRQSIKEQLIEPLTRRGSSRVIDELAVISARMDIAVANGKLHGFEIKSEADNLDRLKAQAQVYNRIFDTVTVVCGPNHHRDLRRKVPKWWGITVVEKAGESVRFEVARVPLINSGVDAEALTHLLWREEMVALLSKIQISGFASLPKRCLRALIVEHFAVDRVRHYVRDVLKSRPNWRFDEPRTLDGDLC